MSASAASWGTNAGRALANLSRRLEVAGEGPQELRQELADPPSPFHWLAQAPRGLARAQLGAERFGLGAAWRRDASSPSALDEPAPFASRWFSMRFDPQAPVALPWSSFGVLRMWSPRLEWRAGVGLTLRLLNGVDPAERGQCRRLLTRLAARVAAPPGRHAREWKDTRLDGGFPRAAWLAVAAEAIRQAEDEHGVVDKLVLARSGRLRLTEPGAGSRLLARLALREPGAWPFLLSWPGGGELLGATPEWLFRRRGRRVTCQALAGTRERGHDAREDRRLGRELLNCDKEGHEQEVVAAWLDQALSNLCCEPPRWGPRHLRRLATLQHLESRLSGRLRPDVGDGDLLAALHPTPALCGRPREAAREWLRRPVVRRCEGGDRGLYGGVLGWLEAGSSEGRVLIRCALREGSRLRLKAGAGLVAGSRPELEWEEAGAKLMSLASAWGGRGA